MNKYAAEKIAQEYYALGVQYALKNAGLLKTAEPRSLLNRIEMDAFADATKGYTGVPYRNPRLRDVARKYDMTMDDIKKIDRKGEAAVERAGDFARALGENNSAKAFGLPYGTAKVPYRD